MAESTSIEPSDVIQGTEVFSCPNVELYFIAPHQHVVTPWKLTTVRIITLNQNDEGPPVAGHQGQRMPMSSPPAYIDAEHWFYPLIPNQSPVFRTARGHYLFPDVTSNTAGSTVGFVLPSTVNDEQRNNFESLLLALCGMQFFPSEPHEIQMNNFPQSDGQTIIVPQNDGSYAVEQSHDSTPTAILATKIADGMKAVAEVASRGISASTAKTVQLLDRGTNYVKTQLEPVAYSSDIPPDIVDVIEFTKEYSGIAVELSGVVASKVADSTAKLVAFLAYYAQTSANWTLSEISGQDETESSTMLESVLEVTESAVSGIGMIYSGLRHAGRIMGAAIANNTVQVVEHVYGPEAGRIVDSAATTVGNVTTLGLRSNVVNPGKVVRRVIKDTGRALLVKPDPNLDLSNFPFLF